MNSRRSPLWPLAPPPGGALPRDAAAAERLRGGRAAPHAAGARGDLFGAPRGLRGLRGAPAVPGQRPCGAGAERWAAAREVGALYGAPHGLQDGMRGLDSL